MPGQTRYLAYLLRLWVMHRDKTLVCRVVLVNPHTGERRAFAELEALFGYLAEEVQTAPALTTGEAEAR